jgi:hypothetical protein
MTTTAHPVPRWAVVAAHLTALTTLPSGLWRIPIALGFSMGTLEDGRAVHVGGWESAYVVSLSIVAESAALLTLGLVRPWGERVPSRIPGIGGRRIPTMAVVVPAALGAVALAAIWSFAFRDFPHFGGLEFSHEAWRILLIACYAPLLLWAPLLAAVTWAYYRRRRGESKKVRTVPPGASHGSTSAFARAGSR